MAKMLFCQSCSMPLKKDEEFATNADGSCNQEYCIFCYKKGQFAEPDLTLERLLENIEKIMVKMKMDDEIVKKTKRMIPQLRRWKK